MEQLRGEWKIISRVAARKFTKRVYGSRHDTFNERLWVS